MKGGKGKCGASWIGWLLVIIGALNWGLVGIGGFLGGNWNVVNLILGGLPALEWIVYILVGIAGVIMLFGCKCKTCKVGGGMKHDKKMSGDMNAPQQQN